MCITYHKTRYALRERWARNPPNEERLNKINNGRIVGERYREPPLFASETLAEALDLSHYGRTNIFEHIENGWHYEKSVTYDAMAERRIEVKREKAEMKHIKNPGTRIEDNDYLVVDGRKKKESRRMGMENGRTRSEDAFDMKNDYSKRRSSWSLRKIQQTERDSDHDANLALLDTFLDKTDASSSKGRKEEKNRTLGLPSKVSQRHNIKGEKLRVVSDKSETILHRTDLIGFPLSTKFACFYLNGEPHLVLSQILQELRNGYGLDVKRLGDIMDGLKILDQMIRPASGVQVRVLKANRIIIDSRFNDSEFGRIPKTVKLIRKSDASRLLGEYLPLEEDENDNIKISRISADMEEEAVEVDHYCQGTARGRLYTTGYIRCNECQKVFKPDAFVCHSHRRTETERVVHWGFDPRRWRDYINLCGADRQNPAKIKRFNQIISEPIPVEIIAKDPSTGSSRSILIPLNRQFNRRPPSPLIVGAESTGRVPEKRKTDEDEDEDETEEDIVDDNQKTIDDDEIQIIEPLPTAQKKDDSLFKAPDPFATPLSRKYTEQALKTKGVDLEGLIPYKLLDNTFQDTLASLQSTLFIRQPTAVYAAAVATSSYNPLKTFLDLLPTITSEEKKLEEDSQPLKRKECSPPPTSSAIVPYRKDNLSLVPSSIPSSTSSFITLSHTHSLAKYNQDLARAKRREEMAARLDQELQKLLHEVPSPVAHRIAQVVKCRDELRDENFMETREELITRTNVSNHLARQVQTSLHESEFLYKLCHENKVPIPEIPPIHRSHVSLPEVFPPVLTPFPCAMTPPTPSLPSTIEPLALPPPPPTVSSTTTRPNQLLNGGRSLSISSPIGIRTVPPSMLGQPGPMAGSSAVRPVQPPPQRVVGQRGRPRGSGGSYQRKHSMTAGGVNAQNVDIQRQIDQQKQQQMQQHLRQLQQLQQQRQQQQQMQQAVQAFAASQASPLALLNGGAISGSPSGSNLLQFGLGTSPVSLASLLASSSLLSSTPQLPTQFSNQLDAANIMANMQLDSVSSVAGTSGLSTPSSAATPTSNGLCTLPAASIQDNMQSFLSLTPEQINQMILQSTVLEQQNQQRADPSVAVVPHTSPPTVSVPVPSSPAVAPVIMMNDGAPLVNFDLLATMITNGTIAPNGVNLDNLRLLQGQMWNVSDRQS